MTAALAGLAGNVPNAEVVTPGVAGFVVFFLLALACYFLFRSFAKHLRRARVTADEEERLAAEQRERDAQERDEPRADPDAR